MGRVDRRWQYVYVGVKLTGGDKMCALVARGSIEVVVDLGV